MKNSIRRIIRFVIKLIIENFAPSIMHYSPIRFMKDGLITSHHIGSESNPDFQTALTYARKEFNELHSLYNEWRLYLATMLSEQLFLSAIKRQEKFKFIECGVGIGMTNYVIQKYLRLRYEEKIIDKFFSYIGIDTFEGIDSNYLLQDERKLIDPKRFSSYSNQNFEDIKTRFQIFRNCEFVQGSIPAILDSIKKPSCNFLHIDLNNAIPEVESLKFFLPLMSNNSIILLDDYAFNSAKIQRLKIDEYCESIGILKPITLPTGQGLLIIY